MHPLLSLICLLFLARTRWLTKHCPDFQNQTNLHVGRTWSIRTPIRDLESAQFLVPIDLQGSRESVANSTKWQSVHQPLMILARSCRSQNCTTKRCSKRRIGIFSGGKVLTQNLHSITQKTADTALQIGKVFLSANANIFSPYTYYTMQCIWRYKRKSFEGNNARITTKSSRKEKQPILEAKRIRSRYSTARKKYDIYIEFTDLLSKILLHKIRAGFPKSEIVFLLLTWIFYDHWR